MQLQSQTSGNVIRQHPLREFSRIEQTVRAVSRAASIFAECGRKQNRCYSSRQMMMCHEIASELIIRPAAQHEFDFVGGIERVQVVNVEAVSFARVRTLDVHDLNYTFRHPFQRPFAAGFEQYRVAVVQEALHERYYFAFLQHRLAACDLDQSAGAQMLDLVDDFFHRHAMAAAESVLAIAPGAAKVTARQTHEHARQPGMRGLTLDGFVNLRYLHLRTGSGNCVPETVNPRRWRLWNRSQTPSLV